MRPGRLPFGYVLPLWIGSGSPTGYATSAATSSTRRNTRSPPRRDDERSRRTRSCWGYSSRSTRECSRPRSRRLACIRRQRSGTSHTAESRREVTPSERHVHGLVGQARRWTTAFLIALHWDQARAAPPCRARTTPVASRAQTQPGPDDQRQARDIALRASHLDAGRSLRCRTWVRGPSLRLARARDPTGCAWDPSIWSRVADIERARADSVRPARISFLRRLDPDPGKPLVCPSHGSGRIATEAAGRTCGAQAAI